MRSCSASRPPLSAVEMTVAEYLADPRAATEAAERAGYVVVKDDQGVTQMTIFSDRAVEQEP